jgi:hypothetical protein
LYILLGDYTLSFSDTVGFGIEGIIGIFIFVIFFGAMAPSVIGHIQNNSSVIGLPEATILVFSLLVILFVLGVFMRMWKKLTQPERPEMMMY